MAEKQYTVVNSTGYESDFLTFKQAAAYAARIIRSGHDHIPPCYPHLLVCHRGSAVVEITGYEDSYRACVADADIDNAVAGTSTHDEHRYILAACRNAIHDEE